MTTTRDTPQFMRIESYARVASKRAKRTGRRSASGIVAEVLRVPEACPHVQNPFPPEVLQGNPTVALNIAQSMANETYDSLGRRMRKDAHILAGCICSYPIPVAEIGKHPREEEQLRQWIEKSTDWAHGEFGRDHVGAIVLHMDETMPHLHVLLTPPSPGAEPSPLRRAGKAAARAAGRDNKKKHSIERNAFNKEARRLQDSYFASVSQHFGHTRHGFHRRKRMTRVERNIENSQARALMETQKEAAEVRRQLDEQTRALQQYQAKVEKELDARTRAVEQREARAERLSLEVAAQKRSLIERAAIPVRSAEDHLDQLLKSIWENLSAGSRKEILEVAAAVKRSVRTDAGLHMEAEHDSTSFGL